MTGTERIPKTGWRWTQSRANFSPAQFPANREKYREILHLYAETFGDNSTLQSVLVRKIRSSRPIVTGNDQARNREWNSLLAKSCGEMSQEPGVSDLAFLVCVRLSECENGSVNCITCKKEFDVLVADPIISGPFPE